MLRGVEKGIGFMISVTLGIFAIVAVPWSLISFWNAQPEYIQYVITEVHRTTEMDGCDTPFVTNLKGHTTETIRKECGRLGRVGEMIELQDK